MNYQKSKYEEKYLPADKYFAVNYDDSELRPIYISLPDPPNIRIIDGYGLPPLKQKFQRLEIPIRLQQLEKRVFKDVQQWSEQRQSNTITGYRIYNKFWEILTEEQDSYEEEINFIKRVIWYSIHGYWCFIKGKPTYLSPWYFTFLNFWIIPDLKSADKHPEYRYEDRNTELFKWYLYNTHETFKDLDRDGNAVKINGKYEIIELPFRTFYGIIKPKRRRCGETSRALSNISNIAKNGIGRSCPIIADTGLHAVGHYEKKVIPAWQQWPLWFKPVWDGNNSPSQIKFSFPSNIYGEKSINSVIYAIESAGERVVDSDKTHGMLNDESAKLTRVDASTRWEVSKFTMAQGPDIHGWTELPSTIEDFNEGGEEFYNMWMQSDFYKRDRIKGQTKSGLSREFVPAFRAYDKFIDAWGYSVSNTPTKEQIEYATEKDSFKDSKIGAKEYILTSRETLLKSGTSRDLKTYRGYVRKEPIKSEECWLNAGGDVGFPIEQINKRLTELRIDNYNKILVGDFEWRNGIKDGVVDFKEKENGKFLISLLLDRDFTYRSNEYTLTRKYSQKYQEEIDVFTPVYKSRFTVGIDPFQNLNKTEGGYSQSRLSDGGIAVFWELDDQLDKGKDTETQQSNRFVATYRNRPDNYPEFVEDVILVSRYYGAMMYFERNKDELINRVDDRGYSGYFKYRYNIKAEMFDASPGGYAGGESIDNLFNSLRDYFDLRVHAELHHDLLQEAAAITGKEKLKRNDLLAAAGWALEGSKSTYGKLMDKFNETVDEDEYDDFLPQRTY